MIFIGLDDTDTLESRGTGHLARQIAAALAADYAVLGVVRHQLLRDPRVPCTKNNSSAAILLDGDDGKAGPAGAPAGAAPVPGKDLAHIAPFHPDLLERVRLILGSFGQMPNSTILLEGRFVKL